MRGIVNDWLKSYLDGRKQFVLLDDIKSSLLTVLCGVPQGSILGPKLFILYINDIVNVLSILNMILFADDTNAFCSGSNLNELAKRVSGELDKLKDWFDVNKLSLNVSKINFMLFRNRNTVTDIKIYIKNHIIDRAAVTKFLRILIDEGLNWKEHINLIKSKLSKTVSIVGRCKNILDKEALYILYCTLFLPYINYCSEAWGNTYVSNLTPICILQKRIVRIINKVGFLGHTNELFIENKILKFLDLVKFKMVVIMYKVRNKLLPTNIQKLFYMDTTNNYDFRYTSNFRVKYCRTTKKAMCLSITGVKLWNCLEEVMCRAKSIFIFKKLYKVSVFNFYKGLTT